MLREFLGADGSASANPLECRGLPQMDEEARRYIPQHPAAQNLYTLLREHFAKSILEAMREVLEVAVGSLSGEPDTELPA